MLPFFTIVTATYNAAATLPRLLESLACQTCRDFELLIQDGLSTDDSIAIADAWHKKIPFLSLESRKDKGIYDAWNKALPRIRGQWVLFLGADDLLASADVLDRAKELLMENDDTVLLAAGSAECFENLNEPIFTTYNDKELSFKQRKFRIPFCHTSLFARANSLHLNSFDAKYVVAGDYEWILRVAHDISQIAILPLVVSRFSITGISSSSVYQTRGEFEVLKIRAKYFPVYFFKSLPNVFFLYLDRKLFTIKQFLKPYMHRHKLLIGIWDKLRNLRKFLTRNAFYS